MIPDTINACFELGGALLIWCNVRRLWRDKTVRGVFAPVFVFYTAWGFWNCLYYPAIGQRLSFYAGLGTTLGNLAWVCLAWRCRRNAPAVPAAPNWEQKYWAACRKLSGVRLALHQHDFAETEIGRQVSVFDAWRALNGDL